MALAFPFIFEIGRGEKEYAKMVTIYEHKNATPATGTIAREIGKKSEAGDRVEVHQPDYTKPRSLIVLNSDNKTFLTKMTEKSSALWSSITKAGSSNV
jgi:hypothetical protein